MTESVCKHSFSDSVAEIYPKLPLEVLDQSRSEPLMYIPTFLRKTGNRIQNLIPANTPRRASHTEVKTWPRALDMSIPHCKFLIHSLATLYMSLSLSYSLHYSIISILFFRRSFYNQPYCNLLSHC